MKVLVTGAGGFIGRATVAALVRHGHHVRAVIRPAADATRLPDVGPVEVVRADLRGDVPVTLFDGVDAVVHLAAADKAGDVMDQFAGTVVGTERLLTVMAATATRRLVLVSSFAVYDWSAGGGELTESSPLAADLDERGAYAIAKAWQERVARRLSAEHGFALTVVRPGVVWGDGSGYRFGVFRTVAGRAHLVIGPRRRLPLTYVENCAEAIVAALETPRAIGETVNVVDGNGVRAWPSTGEYLARTGTGGVRVPIPYPVAAGMVRVAHAAGRALFGPDVRLPSVLVPARFEARFRSVRCSTAKAAHVLGWRPTYTFPEAIERAYGPRRPSAMAGDRRA